MSLKLTGVPYARLTIMASLCAESIPATSNGGIGFGIPGPLRFLEHHLETLPFAGHSAQNIIRGAIDDAVDGLNGIAGQPFRQGPDRPGFRRPRWLQTRDPPLARGRVKNLLAMHAPSNALFAVTTCFPAASHPR